MRRDSARSRAKHVAVMRERPDSAPPASTKSQALESSRAAATAMAVAPEAQALETVKLGPAALRLRATSAAAMLGTLLGRASGDTSAASPCWSLPNSCG